MFEKEMRFGRKHLLLSNLSHLVGGFGLALVLQHYLVGNTFLPVWMGWILVAFTAGFHIYEFTR